MQRIEADLKRREQEFENLVQKQREKEIETIQSNRQKQEKIARAKYEAECQRIEAERRKDQIKAKKREERRLKLKQSAPPGVDTPDCLSSPSPPQEDVFAPPMGGKTGMRLVKRPASPVQDIVAPVIKRSRVITEDLISQSSDEESEEFVPAPTPVPSLKINLSVASNLSSYTASRWGSTRFTTIYVFFCFWQFSETPSRYPPTPHFSPGQPGVQSHSQDPWEVSYFYCVPLCLSE